MTEVHGWLDVTSNKSKSMLVFFSNEGLSANGEFGSLVVWGDGGLDSVGIPENEMECYLPLESQGTNPNHQFTTSWDCSLTWILTSQFPPNLGVVKKVE